MENADKTLKEQIVNVLAVLSDNFEQTYMFENILISGENEKTVVAIPEQIRGHIKAFVLNQCEFAYGVFLPDQKSITFFETNLHNTGSAMIQLSICQ